MPPEPEFVVPVIAHRVYGRRNTRVSTAIRRPSDDERFFGDEGTVLGLEGSLRENRQVIDKTHGTPRTWQEIDAMYEPDATAPGSDGSTVNDLWAGTGIRFRVVGRIDSMISSAYADFGPRGLGWRPEFQSLHRPGGINVFYFRELEGRWGSARQYLPNKPDQIPHALMSDALELPDEPGPTGRWQRVLVTLAHEFGHVLGLGHVAWIENVMYGEGTTSGSRELQSPQISTCRYRAAYLSGALAPPAPRRPPRA